MPLSRYVATATITLQKIEEIAIYQSEIISSNGNIFKPYDIKTNLTFNIYHEFKNVSSQFTDIEWTRFSFDVDKVIEDKSWGAQYTGKRYIEVDKSTIDKKCLIQADAYTVIKGVRTCVASARITLIDVNELYSSDTPPDNPINGSLWIDTSSTPLIIYSWNGSLKKWEAVGTTTPFVRNLILNSNFWKLNTTNFIIENDECLLDTKVNAAFEKNWLRLKNSKLPSQQNTAGISQTTSYPILKNSDYTISFLCYKENSTEYTGSNVYIKVISIDANGTPTDILTMTKTIGNSMTQLSQSFRTVSNTSNIKIIIGTEPGKMCDFYITELSLYNTNSFYPWELAPEDIQEQLSNKLDNDHIAVFNALTRNKSMEGIYTSVDENGNEHFYFNATHIKTGSLDGGLINGVGLNIRDDTTGQSIFHVYKDNAGTHIDMTANNLYIGPAREVASTMKYVDTNITSTKQYADSNIATNRAESEKILNGNISTAKSDAINSAKSYTDTQIAATVTANENYTNNQVGATSTTLISYVDTKAQTAESNAKAYTDDLIEDLTSSNNNSIFSLKKQISKAKDDAISASKKYTDDEIDDAKSDMQDYIDDISKNVNDTLNNKVNNDIFATLSKKVDDIDSRTSNQAIINTLTSSTTYTNDMNSKVNVDVYNKYVKDMDSKVSELEGAIPNIEQINSFDLLTVYTNQGITNSGNSNVDKLLVDEIIDNITFITKGSNITMNVTNLSETNYIKETDSNTYIDNNEMIKLLLYEIKNLKEEINGLKNNL
jgi:hypothetical protein